MKKRHLIIFALSLAAAAVLNGCGGKTAPAPGTEAAVETETSEETAAEQEEAQTEEEETVSDAENAEASGSVEEAEEIFNNGGHFVKVGDKVYFRMPGLEQMADAALWGEYADAHLRGGADIISYDPGTAEVTYVLADNGFGRIYAAGDYLYLQEMNENENSYVYRIRRDGTEKTAFDELSVCGIKDDLVIMSGFDKTNYDTSIHIYKDEEIVDFVEPLENLDENGHEASKNKIVEFVGLADQYVIYRTVADTADGLVYSLWSHDLEDGSERYLGQIPDLDEYASAAYGCVDQFVCDQGLIYVGLSYYAGTGHMFNGEVCLVADPAVTESMTVCELESAEPETVEETEAAAEAENAEAPDPEGEGADTAEPVEESEEFVDPKYTPFIVENGKVKAVEGIPGKAAVDPATGRLCYYDENGSSIFLDGDYSMKSEDNLETMLSVELAEYVDGSIFLIQNMNIHVPEEDIGWRTAYRRTETKIKCVDGATSEAHEIMGLSAE